MRVLTDTGTALDEIVDAMREMLDGGPALTVLPAQPEAWQARVRQAVRPERDPGSALVVPTSGSSGGPEGVVLGADAVRWSAEQTAARLDSPSAWVLALPLTHVAGLMVLARAVTTGASLTRLHRDGDTSLTRAVHEAADRAAAGGAPASAISLVPTQVRRLLADDPAALRRFGQVLVGGAALDPKLRERAEVEGVRLVASYGMTETCGGFVHDGVPLAGAELRLDSAGLITVDGPMLARAYRGSQHDDPLPRPFPTRDVGRWDDGRLVVIGRADEVVTTGGVSVPLPAVDALLREHPDVADAAAVAVPDAEWGSRIVGVVVPARALDPAELRAYVAGQAEAAYVPYDIVVVDGVPRPAPDKVDRAALAALVQEG